MRIYSKEGMLPRVSMWVKVWKEKEDESVQKLENAPVFTRQASNMLVIF